MSAPRPSTTAGQATSRRHLYMELTKARLSALVVVTAAVGFLLGSPDRVDWVLVAGETLRHLSGLEFFEAFALLGAAFGRIDWWVFGWTIIGTGLAAGGTNGLNQWVEADRDALMHRTSGRPLPSGAMTRNEALLSCVGMVLIGFVLLLEMANPLAAFLAILTCAIYVLIYTPLKTRSTLNTLVGAVCGAIPPMIGWAAASGELGFGAWLLAAVLFIWQLPHFLALAWMYREDYERGGYRMLPIVDRSGVLTGQIAVLTSLLLIPLGFMFFLEQVTGMLFIIGAFGLGLWLSKAGFALYVQRTNESARRLFMASIIYLPIVLILMVIDQQGLTPGQLMAMPPELGPESGLESGEVLFSALRSE